MTVSTRSEVRSQSQRSKRGQSTETKSKSRPSESSAPARSNGDALDPDLCYRAIESRDARFDGRFFTAVLTTGIYCRPICPARTPKRVNVRFFLCAAAAEAAGFRACRRCHPESAPGSPAWQGTGATLSRALRLIDQGALDEGNIDELASRLGLGARHLRRLFLRGLGASPVAVAQTRRSHFARRLLRETSLPMTEVAYAAGFSSVRRFNSALRHAFGCAPSEFRRAANGTHLPRVVGALRKASGSLGAVTPGPSDQPGGQWLHLRLTYRPPYDWDSLIEFLGRRAIPGVESVSRAAYRRSIRVGRESGLLEVRPAPEGNALLLAMQLPALHDVFLVSERVRRLFDLGADPLRIQSHLSEDAWLSPRIRRRPGLRVPGAWDGFELAVRAVLGQQVTVPGATTLSGRLVEAFGSRIAPDDQSFSRAFAPKAPSPEEGSKVAAPAWSRLTHLFPLPEVLAEADLSRIGMPRARAEAIRQVARAVVNGDVRFDGSLALEDSVELLRSLPGIGDWTAHYIAMRALGEPDAFPAGDLVLRQKMGNGDGLATVKAVERRAEIWRPWRAYAAMQLWRESMEEQ